MKKHFFIPFSVFISLLIFGCFNPSQSEEMKGPEEGLEAAYEMLFDLPTSIADSISIQDCRAYQRTHLPADARGIFEPVRMYMGVVREVMNLVKDVIQYLKSHKLPDNGEFISDTGERYVVKMPGGTIGGVQYDKQIEVWTADNKQYFEIHYMQREVKGVIIFKPDQNDFTDVITGVSIEYDGRYPSKKLVYKQTADAPEQSGIYGYLTHTYFNINREKDFIIIEGGAQATDFTNRDPDVPNEYRANHTYMIKAKTNRSKNLTVALIAFPKSDVSQKSNLYADLSLAQALRRMFLDWVALNGPKNQKDTFYYFIDQLLSPYNANWDVGTTDLKDAVDLYYAENPSHVDRVFYFLLGLDNPVGFDSRGYNSHGDNLAAKFQNMVNGFDLDSEISAYEISQIQIDFVVP